MRDRFPLVALAALLFAVLAGALLVRVSRRGSFAEALSTYRSDALGSRGLFLLAEDAKLPVVRRHLDLTRIDRATGGLALFGVYGDVPQGSAEQDDKDRKATLRDLLALHSVATAEVEELRRYVRDGGRLVYVVGDPRVRPGSSFLGDLAGLWSRDDVLAAFDVQLEPCDSPAIERTLRVGTPSALVAGVETVEARVSAYVSRRSGIPASPLLVDDKADGKAVAVHFRYGEGDVLVVGSVDLASNRVLARADNAQFWLSALAWLTAGRTLEFDEFHHGFEAERTVAGYAAAHGLHWVLLQALLALWLWIAALRRFGRPVPVRREERTGKADYLLAMARIYQLGGHVGHAAERIVQGLARKLASRAGVPVSAAPEQVAQGLERRGYADAAAGLRAVAARGRAATDEKALHELARRAAAVRASVERHPEAPRRARGEPRGAA